MPTTRTEEFHGQPLVEFDPDGEVGVLPRAAAWHISAPVPKPPEFHEVFTSIEQAVDVVHTVTGSNLPRLEHLDLWPGHPRQP